MGVTGVCNDTFSAVESGGQDARSQASHPLSSTSRGCEGSGTETDPDPPGVSNHAAKDRVPLWKRVNLCEFSLLLVCNHSDFVLFVVDVALDLLEFMSPLRCDHSTPWPRDPSRRPARLGGPTGGPRDVGRL